jgi:hypothetical protein
MKKWIYGLIIATVLILSPACSIIQNNNKENFTEGEYFIKEKGKQRVFANMQEDTVQIYYMNKQKQIETSQPAKMYPVYTKEKLSSTKLYVSSFDVDFLTLILKLRPATSGMEAQMNTNINGVLYFGRRIDAYTIKYNSNPLKDYNRQVNHYGFSMGGFVGIGGSTIGPNTTNNQLSYEYDGIILNKGIAAILAIDNFTLGFSVGFDNLLDKNRNLWIYQNKPNIGLAVGMNLN